MNVKRIRALSRVTIAAGLGLATLAAKPPEFGEVATVVAVEVPVQVIAGAEPVRGLGRDDFEVYMGRKKQTLTGFEVIDLGSPSAPTPQSEVSAAARRHFLFLFDLAFSEPTSVLKARSAARDALLRLHPSDLAAVATYDASQGAELVLGFTSDRRQIRTALESLGRPTLVDRRQDPLRMVLGELKDAVSTAGEQGNVGKADTSGLALEQLQGLAQESTRADRTNQEARVKAMTRSLADLGRLMAGVQGRKHVVFLSEGIESSLLVGAQDVAEQAEMATASAEGEYWKVDSDERFGSTRSTNALGGMLEEFRRSDCAIQAVDISGLRAGGETVARRGSGLDSLVMMAKDTGGEVFQNFGNLGDAMGQMLDRTSVTYVLTFQPQDLELDGAFHKVRVELKNAPRGARLVHRPGFYAPKPASQQAPLERLFDAATALMDRPGGAFPVAALAAPFFLGGEKSHVPVVIEIEGKSLAAGSDGPVLPAELYVYALTAEGSIADFLSQNMGFDLAKVGPALQQSGIKFFGHLDLAPGSYTLRVLVRNSATGATSLRVVPLAVPAVRDGAPALLPPLFPEPLGQWLMVREAQVAGEPPAPYLFMSRDQPFVPASLPVLTMGRETAVSLVGYNWGSGELRARAVAVDAAGKETAVELKLLEREPAGPAGPDRVAASLLPPRLAPGEYRLRVTVASAAGQTESSAAFVVR